VSRRLSSRKVALTATFLALAAGGAAACDAPSGDDWDSAGTTTDTYEQPPLGGSGTVDDEESTDEVFYCADETGEIVAEKYCADDGTSAYFLWHSAGYPRGLKPGTVLDGGDSFPAGDRQSRKDFKLPSTGRVANGTIKTNVVGRGSSGSSSSGDSSSFGDSSSGG
jgi:hypothetical protein